MILAYTVLIALAAFRLWRLAALDGITETPRERVYTHTPAWVEDLVQCPHCLGSWLAFGVTWLTDATIGLEAPVLVALAAAALVGFIGERV